MRRSVYGACAGFVIWSVVVVSGVHGEVTPDEVLLVVNDSSQISTDIGIYYEQVRSIPPTNVFHLAPGTSTAETISRSTYNAQIRDPLIEFLTVTQPHLQDQIKFIVLTKGVPHRVSNSGGSGPSQSAASVDSELSVLFTGFVPDSGQMGRLVNPYFGIPVPFDVYKEEFAGSENISYLVFRLDGYQTNIDPGTGVPGDIKTLIDNAQSPTMAGQFVLDATSTGGQGNDWMGEAASFLGDAGVPFTHDTDPGTFLKNQVDIAAYCSWGSNDPSDPGAPYYGEIPPGSGDVYPGNFLPGAIATTYVSTSARTFTDGSQNYGQSLIADLIRLGVAAVNGHVFEPFLDAVSRPQLVFRSYLEGCCVGEAFYQSIQYLSWENVIVCDPLMRRTTGTGVPPEIASLNPFRGPHVGGTEFNIVGDHYRTKHDTTASLGGSPIVDIDVPRRTTITGTTPAHEPGPVEVTVTTPFGTATAPGGFLYTPALTLDGVPGIGQTITINIWGQVAEDYLIFLSFGTACLPFPPMGKLGLDPSQAFQLLISGFMLLGTDSLTGTIPNDPGLSGVDFHLQALIGRDIPNLDAYFSNVLTISIP